MRAIVDDGMRTRTVFSVCCRCSESTTGVRPERIMSGGRPLRNNAGQETISNRYQEIQSECVETTLLIVSGGAETNSRRCQKQYFAGRVFFYHNFDRCDSFESPTRLPQVAARAQPFTAHLDFDLSNNDADNLQQVTTGKAMQLLKAFVEESVREELSSGTWTAVWVKDACRCVP